MPATNRAVALRGWRMFGLTDAAKDVVVMGEACARMAIKPFYDVKSDSLDHRIRSDPNVLGIIQGMIVGQCLPLMGEQLDG